MATVPEVLRNVPQDILENYVVERLKEMAVPLARELLEREVTAAPLADQMELILNRALYSLRNTDSAPKQRALHFSHQCKFHGCRKRECQLCVNNPLKQCTVAFDEAYADNQVLRTRCDSELAVQLYERGSEASSMLATGIWVQIAVIDGDAYDPESAKPVYRKLLKNDAGEVLLDCIGQGGPLPTGELMLALPPGGRVKLPDVFITDKNDTFKLNGEGVRSFRVAAFAMRKDPRGCPVPLPDVAPAVSPKLVIKTQRALSEYRKCEFPHHRDELTTLRNIGTKTALRLKKSRGVVAPDVPEEKVADIASFKRLVEYSERHRHVEAKLLEMLNMKGKHRYKWDYLKKFLKENIVYDDDVRRVWLPPSGGAGLLYDAKQAQMMFDEACGLASRVCGPDSRPRYQCCLPSGDDAKLVSQLQLAAEAAWHQPGHPGWHRAEDGDIDWLPSLGAVAQQAVPAATLTPSFQVAGPACYCAVPLLPKPQPLRDGACAWGPEAATVQGSFTNGAGAVAQAGPNVLGFPKPALAAGLVGAVAVPQPPVLAPGAPHEPLVSSPAGWPHGGGACVLKRVRLPKSRGLMPHHTLQDASPVAGTVVGSLYDS